MIDIAAHLDAIHRHVGSPSSETVGVVLTRSYPASAADVWDALTTPDRMKRWFLPVSGDLREGGEFHLEGNAGGEILRCVPPTLLRVTFGGPTSVVELRLSEAGSSTTLELEHTVPLDMAGSAAGALYVGPGWDGAFMGLALHLAGEEIEDPTAMANSLEVQEFSMKSIHLWAAVAAGAATADEIAAATEVSLAQFAPDVPR